MIAFAGMLLSPAKEAGMKIPDDADDFDPAEFPHFDVYLKVQLGAAMPSMSSHWNNAKLIAGLSDEKIKTITYAEILEEGLEVGNSSLRA
jgi:hypothetical protein